MIPDHTQALEEGEAFAVSHINSSEIDVDDFDYLLAMTSPIYFSGDLIKLKIVSLTTLAERRADVGFFLKLKSGLVLSTKGNRSAADMMSGGDFAVGQIVDAYKQAGLWDNTVMVFSSGTVLRRPANSNLLF